MKTKLSGAAAIATLLAALAFVPAFAQDTKGKMGHGGMHGMNAELQKAIGDTSDCLTTCERTIAHCIDKGGKHVAPDHLKLMMDCVEICKLDVGFMARQSTFHGETCGLCADICRRCAESCEKLASDDPMMKECVDACRKCSESCRKMAKGVRGS